MYIKLLEPSLIDRVLILDCPFNSSLASESVYRCILCHIALLKEYMGNEKAAKKSSGLCIWILCVSVLVVVTKVLVRSTAKPPTFAQ